MPKTIMVTGGSGFLGSYVCRLLAEQGYRVVSYDIVPLQGKRLYVHKPVRDSILYARGQITDLSHVIAVCQRMDVDAIVHAAAFVGVEDSVEQAYFTYEVNSKGAIVVYETARLLNMERVVLISSNAVYQAKQYEPIDEKHPVFSPSSGNPAAHYGASKLAAEIIGLTYCMFNGVDLIALRMSSIYGFGMQNPLYVKPMVESAVLGVSCNFPTGGDMQRDYTYVRDSARAVLGAVEADSTQLSQRVFNISGGRLYSARQVADIVKELVPTARLEIGPGLSIIEQSDIKARGMLDCTRAKEVLGYSPGYDLRQGIQDYIALMNRYLQDSKKEDERS